MGSVPIFKSLGRRRKFDTISDCNFSCACGGNPILADDGTAYFNDMLGTSLAAVGNGNAEAFSLTAFGDTIPRNAESGESARSPFPISRSPFYTGKPNVPGLGYAFFFRNYRASLGKWQTSDPIGYPDGWNQLAYCGNGAASAVDLWGCLTVNVWDSSEDGWGHASITLDDGTYISWWPDDDAEGKIGKSDGPLGNIYDASAIKNRTYEDDFSDEKKREPWKMDISGFTTMQ